MKRLAIIAILALLSSPAFAATADPFSPLKNFAIADLQAALDDATANNDTDAATCYGALIPMVQAAQSPLEASR